MGVLVLGPDGVTTDAIMHVLLSLAFSAKRVNQVEASASVGNGRSTSVVFVPGPGVDPTGLLDAMHGRPGLQLVVVAESAVDVTASGPARTVVANNLDLLVAAIANHQNKSITHGLTNRHVRILQQLADGHSPADAAVHLGISVKTLNNHLSAAYKRLGAKNATQAVLIALRAGVIRLS